MQNWYLLTGNCSDVVRNVEIKFQRNLKNINFFNKMNLDDYKKVINEIKKIFYSFGYEFNFFKLNELSNNIKMEYVEEGIVPKEFIQNMNDVRAIIINEEENICIMLNENAHIVIKVFSSGLEFDNILNIIKDLDKKIFNRTEIAYSDDYGFLTSELENVGTGTIISSILYLPALELTQNISQVLNAWNTFGVNIKKIESKIYEISIKQNINLDIEDSIKKIKIIIQNIIKQERIARRYLAENSIELEDKVYRAYGILKNCRKISINEAKKMIFDVKIGVDLGIIKEVTDSQILKMFLYIQNAHMQKYFNKKIDYLMQDIERANIVKLLLN